MIELIFSLLLTAPELEKKYEYCYKPNRCQMVNAVVYNTVLIRDEIQAKLPVFTEKFSCRVSLKLSSKGYVTSVTAIACPDKHFSIILGSIASASPLTVLAEAYSQVKDINLTISP
ncbi:hypothetical protein [Rheinheimera pacifica]|uniref:hypothetical protein n=1 Tax=Rheinheimera pacifica TaxID=173990 RepID=UPI002ED8E2A7